MIPFSSDFYMNSLTECIWPFLVCFESSPEEEEKIKLYFA